MKNYRIKKQKHFGNDEFWVYRDYTTKELKAMNPEHRESAKKRGVWIAIFLDEKDAQEYIKFKEEQK